MEERREISRVEYKTNGVVVICDTQEKIYVDVKDISPLGMGICVPEGHEGLLGKQVIVVAETLIMYAEVSREEKHEDGSTFIGVHVQEESLHTGRSGCSLRLHGRRSVHFFRKQLPALKHRG